MNSNVMNLDNPWMVVGDFDSVISMDETSSSKKLDNRRCSDFVTWISEPYAIWTGALAWVTWDPHLHEPGGLY